MTRMKVFILLAAFTVLFSSCQKQESDPVIRTAENTYYSSYSVMLDLQGEAHLKTAFKINDHICASCFCYDNGKEIYSIRLLDKTDGKIVSSQDITLGYTASLCCKTGDKRLYIQMERITRLLIRIQVRSVRYGSFGSVNSLLQAGKNGSFVYYGFPSYGGSTYCIAPVGLTAISASSKNPDACFEFLEYLYSYETQMAVLSSGRFPMNDDVYNKYIDSMMNPGAIAAEDHLMRLFAAALGGQRVSPGFKDSLNIAVNSVNMVKCIDFSVYKILTNEVNSYYQHGKTPEKVGASLRSRLKVYVDENYT